MESLKPSFYRLLQHVLQGSEVGVSPAKIGQSSQVLTLDNQRLRPQQQGPACLCCVLP